MRLGCCPRRHASCAEVATAHRQFWHLHEAIDTFIAAAGAAAECRPQGKLPFVQDHAHTAAGCDCHCRSVCTCGGGAEPSSCGRGSARSSPHSRGLKLLRLAARSSLVLLSQIRDTRQSLPGLAVYITPRQFHISLLRPADQDESGNAAKPSNSCRMVQCLKLMESHASSCGKLCA